MAGTKISELPVATLPLTGTELVPVVQSGATKQTTLTTMPYVPTGTGAVTTTVQAKLREMVSVKDFGAVGDGVTDDTAAIQAAATYAAANYKTLYFPTPTSQYLVTSTINISCSTRGDSSSSLGGGAIGNIVARSNITVFVISGGRLIIENIGIHFDLAAAATSAVGFQCASSTAQLNNSTFIQCKTRYAYNGFKTNGSGVVGTVWNNTFINCNSDFSVDYAWNFNAIVGSTTQTWINCMNDAGSNVGVGAAPGWYTNNVDDVMWLNCQHDECYDGNAIFINLATQATIKDFRSEGSVFRTNAAQLIYCNAVADISNVKLQSSTVQVGAGNRASVIRFGASGGGGVVGNIEYEQVGITSGDLYKVDTNGLQFGSGAVTILDPRILRAEVRRDDVGNRTVFANKMGKYGVDNLTPTVGNYELGDQFLTQAVTGFRSDFGKLCITAGTAGTLSGITASVSSGSRAVTVNSISGLSAGQFITIAGVSGVKRIVSIYSGTLIYIDSDASAGVAGAAVAFSAPAFKQIGGAGKGTTAQRPSPGANDYGVTFLDTTLNANGKPIWWNGTAWVDATGAVV